MRPYILSWRSLFFILATAALSCIFPAYISFHYVSPADNWELGYCWLTTHGLLPYRDIYLNIPTVHLNLMNYYFSIFDLSIVSLKIANLLIRFALAAATCLLCLRFASPAIALVAVFFGMTIHYGDVADPGYNHLALLFAVGALNCAVWNGSFKSWFYIFAGILTSLAFLVKYTVGGAIGVCLVVHLLFELFRPQKKIATSQIIKCAVFFLLSAALGVLIYLSTLWRDGLLEYFYQQVVIKGPQGKGSPWGSLFRPWIGIYTMGNLAISLGLALPLIWSLCSNPNGSGSRWHVPFSLASLVILVSASFLLPVRASGSMWQYTAIYVGFVGCGFLALRSYLEYWRQLDSNPGFRGLACFSAFALAYSLGVSWPAFEGMVIPSLPLFLSLAFNTTLKANNSPIARYWKTGTLAALILYCAALKKMEIPWGWCWQDSPITGNTYQISSPYFSSVKMGKESFELESAFQEVITKKTGPGDTLFVFPSMPGFYGLAERKPVTRSLAHFLDVCPDSVASEDARRLISNPPKVIVWSDMSEGMISFFENQFRDGKRSGQRDIIAAFDKLRPDYDLVYAAPPPSNSIQIYLRKN